LASPADASMHEELREHGSAESGQADVAASGSGPGFGAEAAGAGWRSR
jgi:hypothetical protein